MWERHGEGVMGRLGGEGETEKERGEEREGGVDGVFMRIKSNLKLSRIEIDRRGSRGLVVRRLPGMRKVLGSNTLGTKTLCWFLLCSHFHSSKLLSHVCHSS